jgi:hypothetical protein
MFRANRDEGGAYDRSDDGDSGSRGGAGFWSSTQSSLHGMYDTAETVLIEGTVRSFDWTNPHCWLYITVTDEADQTLEWSLELGSTASLIRGGWRPRTVMPGDAVSVSFHPLQEELRSLSEGRLVGLFSAITLPDGTHIGDVPDVNEH